MLQAGQDQGGALALVWADRAEDVGGSGALVTRRAGTGAALAQFFLARLSPDAWGNFFKILDRALGLSVVARPGREFAVAHGAQLPAERLLGNRDAEFLEDRLRQIDQPPADHAVHCRNWATLDDADDGLALDVVELDGWPGDLPFRRPSGPRSLTGKSPDMTGKMKLQLQFLEDLIEECRKSGADHAICNIASWAYVEGRRRYMSVELSPYYPPRKQAEPNPPPTTLDHFFVVSGDESIMVRTFKPHNCLVAFRLPILLLRKADFLAAQSDMTRSQLFRRSIVEFVEQQRSVMPANSTV